LCPGILIRCLSLQEASLCLWVNHHCNNDGYGTIHSNMDHIYDLREQ
jgi:hypothetical protein